MDDGLVLAAIIIGSFGYGRLNPCCSGRWSSTVQSPLGFIESCQS